MSNVKVSICVAYYNRSEYVSDCIQSLLDQDYAGFEVVVVNDGSTDPNTAKILNTFDDPRLKVIHQANTGFVGAIRNAIASSTGQYIAIMGAGDVCHPTRISKQATILDTFSNVGIVGCLFENVAIGGPENGKRQKRDYPDVQISANNFLEGSNPIGHGEVMYRRSIYELVGGYRAFFKFAQDMDLWLRMVEHCEVKIIREYLYERRLFSTDGIATDLKKLFLQQYLAHFSRQCYLDRQKLGYDYVDKYGSHAGFFKKPSKKLGHMATSRALQYLKENKLKDAYLYIDIASQEVKSIRYRIVKLLTTLSKSDLGRSLLVILFKIQAVVKKQR